MKVLILLMISGVATFFVYTFWFHDDNTIEANNIEEITDLLESDSVLVSSDLSPFAIERRQKILPKPSTRIDGVDTGGNETLGETKNSDQLPPWGSSLSEDELGLLVERLASDPLLLSPLIDEFRQELDPDRKKRLAMVLGEIGGEQVTLLASELIFSGDSDDRSLGLDLLQDVQPGNALARNIASDLLSNEVDPGTLVDAMTALATPGEVDDTSRAFLSDQLALLTTHEDDSVRSISLDILSRWSDDGRYTEVLVAGLTDSSEYVRASAAYALASHEDQSPIVIDRLFSTLRISAEKTHVKRAVILALRSMPLNAEQNRELILQERGLNTVVR